MFASKVGKFLYRNKITGESSYKGAKVYTVTGIIGGEAFGGQTIGENIFVLERHVDDQHLLAHEFIHVLQWRRFGSLGFVIRYFGEFLVNYIKLWFARYPGDKKMKAYNDISLEQEAREH